MSAVGVVVGVVGVVGVLETRMAAVEAEGGEGCLRYHGTMTPWPCGGGGVGVVGLDT